MKRNKHFTKAMMAFVLTLCMVVQTGMTIISVAAKGDSKTTTIENLQVEYTTNPIGLDANSIRFSWQMVNNVLRGQAQQSYQIMVASSKENLDKDNFDMWDTGMVNSDISVAIAYAGKPLEASTRYYWQVKVWDTTGAMFTSTEQAYFETSLLDSGWGEAQWIGKTIPEEIPPITKFTVDLDFIIDKDNAGIAFGAKDKSNFFVWQVNTYDFSKDNAVYLRPHIQQGGRWTVLPPSSNGSGPEANISENIGYTGQSIIGQKVHMQIAVDNGVINTYFDGNTTSALTYNYGSPIPVGKIAFRHNTDEKAKEVARYDNFVVKDGDGNVLFSEDFTDETNSSFDGGTIIDGMLQIGKLTNGETKVIQNDSTIVTPSAPMLRKGFETTKTVESAKVYATSAGIYELYLNGAKVGKDFFNPGWTDYNKRTVYQTFDVTDMLKEGDNVIGAMLGKGWYCGNITHVGENRFGTEPALIAKMLINYTDGTSEEIVTDASWKYNGTGPITDNNFLNGEKYDATKEMPGWDNINFVEQDTWTPVGVYTAKGLGIGNLEAQIGETVQQIDTLHVQKITEPKPKAFIYDFGQNFAGVVKLDLPGEFTAANPGLKISLRHGEMLNDQSGDATGDDVEGSLYDENLRTFKAIDTYTIKGNPEGETYTPRFTYHGFRYLEITGVEEALPAEWVNGVVLSNALETTGNFESSSAKINQLYSNIVWGQRSNFVSVPTDCPQRNERMGWTGDSQIFARTATYNMASNKFYDKYLADMRSSQRADGAFSDVAPALNVYATYYNNGWGDAGVIIPWEMYQQYGDVAAIEENFTAMKAWVDLLKKDSTGLIRPNNGLGDWLSVVGTPQEITNTAFFAYSAELFSKMAAVIGETETAATYAQLSKDIKSAWRAKFQKEDGSLTVDTQTAYLVALQFDLVEDPEDRATVAKLLADNIKANDYHLTVGFVGVSYLCPVLSEAGYNDVAYRLLEQETYPSWLYSVNQGATTIWERWNSYTIEDGFGPVSMNSFNHYSYGSIGEWMFRTVLGIERDEENPSYKHFILQPTFGGSLTTAKGHYDSNYGTINSGWELDGNDFSYSATVPANTTATLYLPVDSGADIYENGQNVLENNVDGITYVRTENGKAIFELRSGTYTFSSQVVNKTGLQVAVKEAGTHGEFYYTPESWAPFLAVRATAEEYLADNNVTMQQINDIIVELNAAIKSLVHIAETGTIDNPYVIRTIDDLKLLASTVNSGVSFKDQFVKLQNDLDLLDINWTPIGTTGAITSGTGFAGTFDGNNHVISNLKVVDTTAYATFGLFGMISGTVKNLGIEKASITSGSADCRSGGLAGTLKGGLVDNCYVVDATVNPGSRVGAGLIGQNYNGTVKNSFVKNIKASGGRWATFVSDNEDDSKNNKGTIDHCYADGSITSGNKGIVTNSATISAAAYTNGELVALLNQGAENGVWKQGEKHPVFAPKTTTVDKADLQLAITAAAAFEGKQADYTVESWATFAKALATANSTVADDTATQEAVNTATTALNAAIAGLTPAIPPTPGDSNKTILKAVLEYANTAKASDEYKNAIESVKASFDAQLTAAQEVYNKADATQEQVNNAWMKLMNEIHKLGFQAGEKSQLAFVIQKAMELDLNDYVEAGQEECKAMLKAAQDVLANGDAMQGEVDSATEALVTAMLQLRFKANKEILDKVLGEAITIDTSRYTVQSVQALQAAIDNGNAVLADVNATKEQVEEAAAMIEAARNGLVLIETPSTEKPVDKDDGAAGKTDSATTGDTNAVVAMAALMLLAAGAVVFNTKKYK